MRSHALDQLDQRGMRVAFDVELDAVAQRLEQRRELEHVGRGDVACVVPRMHGDARYAGGDAHLRGLDDAGETGAALGRLTRPRVAERRDLVHVDREPHHLLAWGMPSGW